MKIKSFVILFPARSFASVEIVTTYSIFHCKEAVGVHVWFIPIHDQTQVIAGMEENALSAEVWSMLSFHLISILVLFEILIPPEGGLVLIIYGG